MVYTIVHEANIQSMLGTEENILRKNYFPNGSIENKLLVAFHIDIAPHPPTPAQIPTLPFQHTSSSSHTPYPPPPPLSICLDYIQMLLG